MHGRSLQGQVCTAGRYRGRYARQVATEAGMHDGSLQGQDMHGTSYRSRVCTAGRYRSRACTAGRNRSRVCTAGCDRSRVCTAGRNRSRECTAGQNRSRVCTTGLNRSMVYTAGRYRLSAAFPADEPTTNCPSNAARPVSGPVQPTETYSQIIYVYIQYRATSARRQLGMHCNIYKWPLSGTDKNMQPMCTARPF